MTTKYYKCLLNKPNSNKIYTEIVLSKAFQNKQNKICKPFGKPAVHLESTSNEFSYIFLMRLAIIYFSIIFTRSYRLFNLLPLGCVFIRMSVAKKPGHLGILLSEVYILRTPSPPPQKKKCFTAFTLSDKCSG
jgi:hypothetical protein